MLITHGVDTIHVPGFVSRCSAMDSVLHSTLECLYSTTNCLRDTLLYYLNYTTTVVAVAPLQTSQLVRTTRKSTVAILVDNLFVEKWTRSFSYLKYFQACAPSECHYTYVKRANHLYVLTMFLSFYGGLTLVLRLVVKLLLKFIVRCRRSSALQTGECRW